MMFMISKPSMTVLCIIKAASSAKRNPHGSPPFLHGDMLINIVRCIDNSCDWSYNPSGSRQPLVVSHIDERPIDLGLVSFLRF
jgi:hypothetical protein